MDNILLADTYIITAIHGFVKIKLLIWLRRKEKPPVVRSRAGFPRVVYQNALHRMVVCITSHPSELVEFFPPARQCHPDTKRTCASMDAPLTLAVLALPLALTHHAVSLVWNWQVQKFGHENHLPNLPKRAKDSIARLGRCGQQNLIKEWRNERLTLKELRARAGLLQKDVARRADVSIIAVSNWELGKNGIARKYKKKLVRLYGCTPQELDEAIEGSRKEQK